MDKKEEKIISIVIPTYNEQNYIKECLNSFLHQDYPKEKMEILVVDGMSADKTKELALNYAKKYPFIKVLDNPKRFTPSGFNIGIKNAKGKYICFVGGHSKAPRNYVKKIVYAFEKHKDVDCIGVRSKATSLSKSLISKAIALSLSSWFGAGSAKFRREEDKTKFTDTVAQPCYRRGVFREIGLFNENLIRSQDMELNLRLKKKGKKILLIPNIAFNYYPKNNLKDFFIHNFEDGIWAVYPLKFVEIPLCFRHYIPLIFVLSLIISGLFGIFSSLFSFLFSLIIFLYFLTSVYFSAKIAIKEKDIRLLAVMPIVFAVRHFGYGIGSLIGLIKLIKGDGRKKKERN